MAEYQYRPEQSMPGGAWRRVNQDYVESTGAIDPHIERIQFLPFAPYTRWQRLLHRLRICRWHRHQAPIHWERFIRWTGDG